MKFSETKERVSNDLDFTTTRRLDKYITSKQTLLPKFPPRARQCIFFRGHLGLVAASFDYLNREARNFKIGANNILG